MSISAAPASIGERMTVAGIFPTVAGDFVRAPDAACRQHDSLGAKQLKAAALAIVAERAGDAIAVFQQRRGWCTPCKHRCPGGYRDPAACGSSPGRCGRQRAPAADSDARRNCAAVCGRLWCDRKARPRLPVREHASGASFACSSAMRQLFRYWPPRMVSAKVNPPVVAIVHVCHGRGDAAFGHHGVGFAEQRLAKRPPPLRRRRCLNRRAQSRAACADNQHIVFVSDCTRPSKEFSSPSRCPSSTGAHRGRQNRP